jgi:hypothetical protein
MADSAPRGAADPLEALLDLLRGPSDSRRIAGLLVLPRVVGGGKTGAVGRCLESLCCGEGDFIDRLFAHYLSPSDEPKSGQPQDRSSGEAATLVSVCVQLLGEVLAAADGDPELRRWLAPTEEGGRVLLRKVRGVWLALGLAADRLGSKEDQIEPQNTADDTNGATADEDRGGSSVSLLTDAVAVLVRLCNLWGDEGESTVRQQAPHGSWCRYTASVLGQVQENLRHVSVEEYLGVAGLAMMLFENDRCCTSCVDCLGLIADATSDPSSEELQVSLLGVLPTLLPLFAQAASSHVRAWFDSPSASRLRALLCALLRTRNLEVGLMQHVLDALAWLLEMAAGGADEGASVHAMRWFLGEEAPKGRPSNLIVLIQRLRVELYMAFDNVEQGGDLLTKQAVSTACGRLLHIIVTFLSAAGADTGAESELAFALVTERLAEELLSIRDALSEVADTVLSFAEYLQESGMSELSRISLVEPAFVSVCMFLEDSAGDDEEPIYLQEKPRRHTGAELIARFARVAPVSSRLLVLHPEAAPIWSLLSHVAEDELLWEELVSHETFCPVGLLLDSVEPSIDSAELILSLMSLGDESRERTLQNELSQTSCARFVSRAVAVAENCASKNEKDHIVAASLSLVALHRDGTEWELPGQYARQLSSAMNGGLRPVMATYLRMCSHTLQRHCTDTDSIGAILQSARTIVS